MLYVQYKDILIADDDPDDRLMIKECFEEVGVPNPLVLVEDGEELVEYLYSRESRKDLPALIVVDLNMPKKNGFEAINEISKSERLTHIPIAIFSTSKSESDKKKAFELGVKYYFPKPNSFDEMKKVLRELKKLYRGYRVILNGTK
ncbi:response regulator receiver domain-containing protein [Natranaerovirga pectinivora]|uniref:Stage 0 sporulation protein A homolog n=1 Tax=Natranaerovirga pectinivora TaxID=682400 RepID=A0A4R3MIA6_9FIRM|nr:response regulator [Natranaerovirga pectinivora]TCT13848.1 response regulator receiver domain-containing protein [Natranaerovirga pectinivora]